MNVLVVVLALVVFKEVVIINKEKYFTQRGSSYCFDPPLILFKKVLKNEGSYKGTAKWFGVDKNTISKFAKNNNLKSPYKQLKYYLSEDEKKKICNLYQKRTSSSLAKEIGCSKSLIKKVWRENGLKGKGNYIYYYNKNYFNKINSSAKAYYLGFILGDGCIHQADNKQKTFNITIHSKDKEILKKLKKEIETKKPLYENKRNKSKYVTLQLSSDIIAKDLSKYGIVERKSTNYKEIKNIPKNYENDFLRGIFDADGSIYQINKKYYKVSLNGNKKVINYVENILLKNNISFNTHEDTHKSYSVKHFHLRIGSIKEIFKFMKLIYSENSEYKLIRKFKRFEKFKEEYID